MAQELEKDIETIAQHLGLLQKKYHIKSIGVFGSTARGERDETSDVDILVELSKPMGFLKFIEFENFLSNMLDKKADLVTKNALKPAIRERVLKEVIYV